MSSLKVRHFGNTANNAYHNALALKQYAGIESDLPVRMFGLRHAISAPAWEAVDFDVPSAAWVSAPDWSLIPEAAEINQRFSDLPWPTGEAGGAVDTPPGGGIGAAQWAMGIARRAIEPLYGRVWAQPIFDASYRFFLARRPGLAPLAETVDVVYGADSLIKMRIDAPSPRLVVLEHGTIRWLGDGGREASVLRRAYRRQVQQARHLWLTNLDPRTLEIAEEVAPGRWSVLPHPFVLDARVPFAASETRRSALLSSTASDALVLLPSSQNWSPLHDKGSIKALQAFVELRRQGLKVGLVAVEWGLQLAESKRFLAEAGVGDNVAWVAPMARFALQRMMADVDVVWDQFGLDAFGALALRVMEQGAPLVSRGLRPVAEQLIGGPVPWRHAETTDEIVRETSQIIHEISARGREAVLGEFRHRNRTWLLERHSPEITARLQEEIYSALVVGTHEPGTARPGRWAELVADAGLDRRTP